jgi:hypothetical protein
MKIKRTLAVLALTAVTASTSNAAPYGLNVPLPGMVNGSYDFERQTYVAEYDSLAGGHWKVSGRHSIVRDGSGYVHKDTFKGTISDKSLLMVFGWASDYLRVNPYGQWVKCYRFNIKLDGKGNVSGEAFYKL